MENDGQTSKLAQKEKVSKKTFKSFLSASYKETRDDPKFRFIVYVVYAKAKGGIAVKKVLCGSNDDPTCEEVTEQFFTVARKRHLEAYLDNDKANALTLQELERKGGLFSSKLWESNLLWGLNGSIDRNLAELSAKLHAIKEIEY